MKTIKRAFSFLRGMFAEQGPETLVSMMKESDKKAPVSPTDKLYIIEVDFCMSDDAALKLDGYLEPLRQKFGLDFFVQEPGYKLRRFDDV